MASKSSQTLKPEADLKAPQTAKKPKGKNAWQLRDWETLFVAGIFLIALLATAWMIVVSITDPVPDNRYRILPAASLMIMVELWVMLTLPFYSKLGFWGAVLSLATYLFFAVPFVFLGLLPDAFSFVGAVFIVISLIAALLLFRQRDRFFPPPPVRPRSKPLPPKTS